MRRNTSCNSETHAFALSNDSCGPHTTSRQRSGMAVAQIVQMRRCQDPRPLHTRTTKEGRLTSDVMSYTTIAAAAPR